MTTEPAKKRMWRSAATCHNPAGMFTIKFFETYRYSIFDIQIILCLDIWQGHSELIYRKMELWLSSIYPDIA